MAELKEDTDKIWRDMRSDPELVAEAARHGLDIDGLPETETAPISFRPSGAGIDPLTVAVIVAFAPTVNKIAVSAWTEIILPRIQKRHGKNALGPKKAKK